ncbi:unnamed protein product, partial [Brassica rapa subsp. trilocularis]
KRCVPVENSTIRISINDAFIFVCSVPKRTRKKYIRACTSMNPLLGFIYIFYVFNCGPVNSV